MQLTRCYLSPIAAGIDVGLNCLKLLFDKLFYFTQKQNGSREYPGIEVS